MGRIPGKPTQQQIGVWSGWQFQRSVIACAEAGGYNVRMAVMCGSFRRGCPTITDSAPELLSFVPLNLHKRPTIRCATISWRTRAGIVCRGYAGVWFGLGRNQLCLIHRPALEWGAVPHPRVLYHPLGDHCQFRPNATVRAPSPSNRCATASWATKTTFQPPVTALWTPLFSIPLPQTQPDPA